MDKLKFLKNIFLKKKMLKIKIIAFIVLIVFLLLPCAIFYLKIEVDGKYIEGDLSNVPFVVDKEYIANAKFGSDGIYFEKTNEDGTKTKITIDDIWKNLKDNDSRIKYYLKNAEELEKLVNAEVVTQFPKLGLSDDKLDGTIEFERHKMDGTSKKLKYVDEDTFNDYIEKKDTNAVDYFTINEDGDLLIAVVDKTTEELTQNDKDMELSDYTDTMSESDMDASGNYKSVEYSVVARRVNYKNAISKYTMPFEYLWAFVVISEDKEFSFELADLAKNSEITISIYDNVTTNVNTDEYTYKIERKVDTYAKVAPAADYGVSGYPAEGRYYGDCSTDDTDYKVTHTTIYEKNTPVIDVTKANVWIVDYSKEYKYQSSETTKEENNHKDMEDTDYKEEKDSPRNSNQDTSLLSNGHAIELQEQCRSFIQTQVNSREESARSAAESSRPKNSTEAIVIPHTTVSVNVEYVECNYYFHQINRAEDTKNTESKQKYVESTVKNRPKVEKDYDEDNFVTILSSARHRNGRENIRETSSWLFKILEENDSTNDMVDLTKYLLYKVTEKSYGVKEYDFGEYEENNYIELSYNSNYGDWDGNGSQEDFIKAVAPYAVIDMQQHQIYASVTIAQAIIESGWGKDSIAINYKNFFGMKTRGVSNTGNEYWDGTGVSLNASEGGTSYFRVYDSLANSVYDHGRNFHVTATYSRHGVLDCMSQNLGPKEQLKRIALSGYAVNRDGSIAKPDKVHTYDEYLYEKFIVKYNLTQYDSMTANDFESTSAGKQDIIDIAKSKIGSPYQLGACGPTQFDCSGFVYWVFGQKGVSVPRSTASYSSYVGTDKEISWDQAQPGDILIVLSSERGTTYGHAAIYLGNDQYIHAPKPGDSVKISSGASGHFRHVFRF